MDIKKQKGVWRMLKLILDLLDKLRGRSRSKAEAEVNVEVRQKITVVTINIDNKR